MTATSKKDKPFWYWVVLVMFWPLSLTQWVAMHKGWSKSKKIKIIAAFWGCLLVLGVAGELDEKYGKHESPQAPAQVQNAPTNNVQLVAKKSDETINQEQHEKRKNYDTKRGNNFEAANTAQALVDLVDSVTPSANFDAYIRLETNDKATKAFELGGELQEYKNSVNFVALNVVISSSIWSSASDDQKKDLVASWVKIMQKQYPKAGGWLKVTNGVRDLAEATWLDSSMGRNPEVKLK